MVILPALYRYFYVRYLRGFGYYPVQNDFKIDFARMTNEAN